MSLRTVLVMTSAVLAAGPGASVAGPLPSWAYSVAPGSEITPNVPIQTGEAYLRGNGIGGNDGRLDFTMASGSGLQGNQTIRLATLNAREYVNDPTRDNKISFFNDPYSLKVNITDVNSGQTGTVTISGQMAGYFDPMGATLTNIFTSPMNQTLTVGGSVYAISAESFTAPQTPNPAGPNYLTGGEIDVSISPSAVATPEPATLAMAGLGLGCLVTRRAARRTRA